jgi:hypothetical protein
MVITDYASVLKLESKATLAKPAVVAKNVLIFGSARVLSGNYKDAAAFFKTYLDKGKIKEKDREWVRWFYGFSNLLSSVFDKVEPEFIALSDTSRDALITGISSYFLCNNLAKHSLMPETCMTAGEHGRNRVIKALKNIRGWKKEVDRMSTEIHVAIVRKYIDEAGKWIFLDKQPLVTPVVSKTKTKTVEKFELSKPVTVKPSHSGPHHIISDKKYDQERSNLEASGKKNGASEEDKL